MNKYEQLALLKLQIDVIQQEYDELKNEVMETMLADGIESQRTQYGTISIGKRKAWSYPDYVREYELEFKEAQKRAKRDGEAEHSETPYLMFRPRSEEPEAVEEQPRATIH